MNSVFKMTLGAALTLGAAAVLPAAPAAAQSGLASISLNKAERESLLAVDTALRSGNYPGAASALAAARAAAVGPDARNYVAQFQYQLAVATNDYRMQADAIDALIAGGRVTAPNVPGLYGQLGSLAYNYLRDFGRAERAFQAQVQAAPNSPQALLNLAQMKRDRKRPLEALPLLTRAIAAQRAAGQGVPESWYKMAMDMALVAKSGSQAAEIGRGFVAEHSTKQNWRDALLIHRQLQGADTAAQVDTFRLLRAAGGLSGERDYLEMANALDAAGFAGEARAVIQEGVAARMVDGAKGGARDILARTAARAATEKGALSGLQSRAASDATGAAALKAGDSTFGAGDYAKAAALYQTAVQKGSVDANLANSRLGMALALAGQRAEAEAALRAVTGPRADLAGYWLAWLARRA